VDAGAADADFAVDQAGQINVTPSVLRYVTNVADVAKVSFHDALHSMQPATISVSGGHGNEQHSGNLPLPSQPTPNTPPVPAHITKHTGMSGMDYSRSLPIEKKSRVPRLKPLMTHLPGTTQARDTIAHSPCSDGTVLYVRAAGRKLLRKRQREVSWEAAPKCRSLLSRGWCFVASRGAPGSSRGGGAVPHQLRPHHR